MKKELRKKSKLIRSFLDIEKISEKVKKNLISTDEYKTSKNILAYYSKESEISTVDYFNDETKNWFLPKIQEENLLVCKYEKDKLQINQYNIKEPTTPKIDNLTSIDLILVPAIAADVNGYRIGYGRGYYDRFLVYSNINAKTIILTCEDLLYETIYPDKQDVKCSMIITEKNVYRIKC